MQARRKWLGMIVLSCLISVLVISCGSEAAPTATVLPAPTSAPQPTSAPKPTTAPATQPPAAAGSSAGGPLQNALSKAKTANSYRVNMSITGKGQFAGDLNATPVAGAEDKPITLIQMQGEVNGKDAHFSLQGMLTSFLGIEPDKTFEVMSYDGKSYLKGPVPLLGAIEDKWYQAPSEASSIAQPPLTPNSFLESFGEAGIDPSAFKEAGTETLDGQSCQVFAGDKDAVVQAFNKLGGATGATQEDLSSIDSAEFKFWVCGGGYLHQVRMALEGHDKNKPDQKGSFEVLMKITDFNTNITITPPADAVPLKLPQFGATPTP